MLVEVIFPRESDPAMLALVGLFASMNPPMNLEMTLGRIPLVAYFAAERSFAGVNALVNLELTLLTELCATFIADVGLLAGVHSFVYMEVACLSEAFTALFAHVGLFSAVRPSVTLKDLFPLKNLSAGVTAIVHSVAMSPPMRLQGLL